MDRDLPEGVIDADPPGGWEGVSDEESAQQNAEAQGSPELTDDATQRETELLTDAAVVPDDPIAGEQVRQGADPDLGVDRGEEP
ncbi:MAG: hypothetical protein ABW024_01530 [Microbacterium sp.]